MQTQTQIQDAPADIMFQLWPWLEANRNRLIGGVVAGFIVVGAYSFNSWRVQQKELKAGEALTTLLATASTGGNAEPMADSLVKFAAEHAGTGAGQRAQLQGASALFDAGRFADAQTQFQKFLADVDSGTLAATAQLGLATSLEAQGKADQAIPAYQKAVSLGGSTTPPPPSTQAAKAALARLQKPAAQPAVKP